MSRDPPDPPDQLALPDQPVQRAPPVQPGQQVLLVLLVQRAPPVQPDPQDQLERPDLLALLDPPDLLDRRV